MVAAGAALPSGKVRHVGPLPVIVPIAAPASPGTALPEPRVPPRLSLVEPDIGPGPPTALDPALTEATPEGMLPRAAPDGTRPLTRYARPAEPGCRQACVAVVVTGLGLLERLGERALALPAGVALSFAPYADAVGWQARARAAGHEVLLGLPLEPVRAQDDAGPLGVRVELPADAAITALRRVLARGAGYVALDAEAGAFATSTGRFAPLAGEIRARGLGLIEIDGAALAGPAQAVGLPYARAMPVDLEPMPAAIDRSLAEVASRATREGRALATVGPSPASLERLAAWLQDLPARDIELVPPSRLLLDAPASSLARQ